VLAAAIWVRPNAPKTVPKASPQGEERVIQEKTKPVLEPGNPPAALTLLGTVQSEARATLTTRMPARIVSVAVREGDSVRAGQSVVLLDATDFKGQERTAQAGVQSAESLVRKAETGREAQRVAAEADITTAQAGLRLAQSRLRQALLGRDAARADLESERKLVQEGIRKAEAGLSRALETLRGLEELAKFGGVSKIELDGARVQVRIAQSDLETAQAQKQRLEAGKEGIPYKVVLAQQEVNAAQEGVRQAEESVRAAREAKKQREAVAERDIEAARAERDRAKAGVAAARDASAALRLISPMAGIATGVSARIGETAQPGMPLVTVVSLQGLRVEALVAARQLPRLRTGQEAQISVDSLPGKAFRAVLSQIARVAEADGRSFKVQFRFREPTTLLRPGQSARITLPEP
jgi:multidrug resistance efflux pump